MTDSHDDDFQPNTLANMIRRKIAEQKAANPNLVHEEAEPQEIDYSSFLKSNDPEVGMSLGAYDLVSLIHAGESANIFLAKHSLMEKKVVAKILNSENSRDTFKVKQMQEEARTMARMSNPQIANTIDFGISPSGHPYMILMPVEAPNLKELLNRFGKPSVSRALQIVEQLAEILAVLHNAGVKYANLKPAHVMVEGADSEAVSLTLVDFSISRRDDSVLPQAIPSLDGAPYMSPEQACGQPIEASSDIYSLACLAFELLSGEPPFSEQSLADYKKAHSSKPPRSFEDAALPETVFQVLIKALSKEPGHRYESVQAFANDLKTKIDSTFLS